VKRMAPPFECVMPTLPPAHTHVQRAVLRFRSYSRSPGGFEDPILSSSFGSKRRGLRYVQPNCLVTVSAGSVPVYVNVPLKPNRLLASLHRA
jgi:hypothetical protein